MIYLDNAATTKICEKAVKAMEPYLKEEYGNPSGIYSIGRKTREQVEKVRWTIAKSFFYFRGNRVGQLGFGQRRIFR